MPLSSSTLAAIQKVGAAAFVADQRMKDEVLRYSKEVAFAVQNTPFSLGNDTLIENWKISARLSQSLASIEEQLKNIFQVASELMMEDQPSVRDMPALPSPVKSRASSKVASVKPKRAYKRRVSGLTENTDTTPAVPTVAVTTVAGRRKQVKRAAKGPKLAIGQAEQDSNNS